MSKSLSILIIVGLLGPGPGCKKKRSESLEVPSKLTLRLHDAGKNPKQKLRYRIPLGDRQAILISLQMTLSMALGQRNVPEISMPVVRMPLTLTAEKRPGSFFNWMRISFIRLMFRLLCWRTRHLFPGLACLVLLHPFFVLWRFHPDR